MIAGRHRRRRAARLRRPGRPQGLERGFYVRPTIFSDVRPRMRIAQEEIFGPVLVDHRLRQRGRGRGDRQRHRATAWAPTSRARTSAAARAVAARIRSGQVHINNPAWDPHAPFGGYKRSGNGREYGVEGLQEYLETKAILGFGQEQHA